MSDDRIALSQDHITALHRAFDERDAQIHRERLHLMVDPVMPPYPGCPACGGPAESVMWAVVQAPGSHADQYELLTDIDPCGHRFRSDLPPPDVTVDEYGRITFTEAWPYGL